MTGTYCGISDPPLTEYGRADLAGSARLLENIAFDHCFSSPLTRCRQSLDLLDIACTYTVEEQLKEIDFGDWEGKNLDDIYANDRAGFDRWLKESMNFTFPAGESIHDFTDRVGEWFTKLTEKEFENVLIVSHSGVLRVGLCRLTGIPVDKYQCFSMSEGRVSKLCYQYDAAIIAYLNCQG